MSTGAQALGVKLFSPKGGLCPANRLPFELSVQGYIMEPTQERDQSLRLIQEAGIVFGRHRNTKRYDRNRCPEIAPQIFQVTNLKGTNCILSNIIILSLPAAKADGLDHPHQGRVRDAHLAVIRNLLAPIAGRPTELALGQIGAEVTGDGVILGVGDGDRTAHRNLRWVVTLYNSTQAKIRNVNLLHPKVWGEYFCVHVGVNLFSPEPPEGGWGRLRQDAFIQPVERKYADPPIFQVGSRGEEYRPPDCQSQSAYRAATRR